MYYVHILYTSIEYENLTKIYIFKLIPSKTLQSVYTRKWVRFFGSHNVYAPCRGCGEGVTDAIGTPNERGVVLLFFFLFCRLRHTCTALARCRCNVNRHGIAGLYQWATPKPSINFYI